jgi:Arc/MetJ-type ribon-helix-helix transcriptional regulator
VNKRKCRVVIADPYLGAMEHLIKKGLYMNRAEIVKDALRRLLWHYNIQVISEESFERKSKSL